MVCDPSSRPAKNESARHELEGNWLRRLHPPVDQRRVRFVLSSSVGDCACEPCTGSGVESSGGCGVGVETLGPVRRLPLPVAAMAVVLQPVELAQLSMLTADHGKHCAACIYREQRSGCLALLVLLHGIGRLRLLRAPCFFCVCSNRRSGRCWQRCSNKNPLVLVGVVPAESAAAFATANCGCRGDRCGGHAGCGSGCSLQRPVDCVAAINPVIACVASDAAWCAQ